MSKKKPAKLLSDIIEKNNISIGREPNDLNAYITHRIQEENTWSENIIQDSLNIFSKKKNNVVAEPEVGMQLKVFPVDYGDIPFPPPAPGTEKFTFIDLFAGIGGFRLAMQRLGGKCVYSSEWDVNSQKTYFANFGEIPYGDITKEENKQRIPKEFDLLCAGFPCQPFSLAGVSKKNSLGRSHGFLDETQGTLFYDIVDILDRYEPKAFILENVKNLRSHDKGNTYKIIKEKLAALGYTTFDEIIDAKNYVPQHRERIFIVGFKTKQFKKVDYVFPQKTGEAYSVKDILEKNPDDKYTLSDHLWTYLQAYAQKHKEKGNGFGFGLVNLNSHTRTLSARYHKDGAEILIPQGRKNPRRLTPNECKSLMGYPSKYKIDNIGVSQTQLYRQFGNSVVVEVIYSVAKPLVDIIIKSKQKK